MLRSDNRILTTHAGSLPRRESLTAMLVKSSRGEEVDRPAMLREIEESTRYVVQKQLEAGIDVGNNGEQSRESFFTYVQHRMTGFGGRWDPVSAAGAAVHARGDSSADGDGQAPLKASVISPAPGRKTAGLSTPRVGWRARTSASAPTRRMVFRSIFG